MGLGFFFLIPLYIFQIYGVFISKVLQGFIRVGFSLFSFFKKFMGDKPIREVHHQNKIKCQSCPPKLVNMNHTISITFKLKTIYDIPVLLSEIQSREEEIDPLLQSVDWK